MPRTDPNAPSSCSRINHHPRNAIDQGDDKVDPVAARVVCHDTIIAKDDQFSADTDRKVPGDTGIRRTKACCESVYLIADVVGMTNERASQANGHGELVIPEEGVR